MDYCITHGKVHNVGFIATRLAGTDFKRIKIVPRFHAIDLPLTYYLDKKKASLLNE